MNEKIQTLKQLCHDLDYEIFADQTLMANAKIGAAHYGIDLSQCTPTFILKHEKGFIALIIQGCNKIDFKKVASFLNVKKVTMASKDEIFNLTESPVGSVSMINSTMTTLVDQGVSQLEYCYGGCGVENHTLKINGKDLLSVTDAQLGDFVKKTV